MYKKLFLTIFIVSPLASIILNAQCLTSPNGEFPSGIYVPTVCNSATQNIIATDCYAGEYSTVALAAGNSYIFSSSIPTDFTTISNNLGTIAYASGSGAVNYTPVTTGIYRFYTHTNSMCGNNQNERSRIIVCTGTTGCLTGTQYPSSNFAPTVCDGSTSNEISANCYAGEYSVVDLTAGSQYTFQSSDPDDVITISDALGTTVFSVGIQFANYNPSVNETVRFYTHTNLACGAEAVDRTKSVYCFSALGGPCLNAPSGMYPSTEYIVPSCTGSPNIIATDCYAGEYSKVVINGGNTYSFESSVATDWITITDSAGLNVLLFGPSPISDAAVSGVSSAVIRFYTHTDSSCGEETVDRSRIITCIGSVGMLEMTEKSISIYPNPASEKISITGNSDFDKIELMTIDGRLLQTLLLAKSTTEMDISHLPKGTYFIKMYVAEQAVTKEFVKM